jgi:hypothetical protein
VQSINVALQPSRDDGMNVMISLSKGAKIASTAPLFHKGVIPLGYWTGMRELDPATVWERNGERFKLGGRVGLEVKESEGGWKDGEARRYLSGFESKWDQRGFLRGCPCLRAGNLTEKVSATLMFISSVDWTDSRGFEGKKFKLSVPCPPH